VRPSDDRSSSSMNGGLPASDTGSTMAPPVDGRANRGGNSDDSFSRPVKGGLPASGTGSTMRHLQMATAKETASAASAQ
jgi:hypothetical protein